MLHVFGKKKILSDTRDIRIAVLVKEEKVPAPVSIENANTSISIVAEYQMAFKGNF